MLYLALTALLVASILAFRNWRHGFALCVLTALLQDPMRKLVPDQPVYFVIFVGVVFMAAWLGALTRHVRLAPSSMIGWSRHLGLPFALFIALALLQGIHSLLLFGNPAMTGIGVISYLAPVPAIALAYRFALSRGERGVRRWMRFYVILASLALATVFAEYEGVDSKLLGEVGGGIFIFGSEGFYKGNSGIFRATEIAAWHAATVGCFAFLLMRGRRFTPPRILLTAGFLVFLLGIGALTGRRKMIVELAIFLGAYFALQAWYGNGNARRAVLATLFGLAGYLGAIAMIPPDQQARDSYGRERVVQGEFGKYSDRAQTVFEELPQRVLDLGVRPVSWAIEARGWLGGGLGVGSQGAQYFGGEQTAAAEGGLGKLTVELGVPGLVIALWLGIALVRYVRAVLRVLVKESPAHANLGFGMVAFILANVAAFSVATQAYADIFILLTLGWAFGFLIALPLLAEQARRERPVAAAVMRPAFAT
jgi:hypothetical protein